MAQDYKTYAEKRLAGGFSEMNSWTLVAPRVAGMKVLDVGCSDGLYLHTLSPESIGVEQIPELAAKARTSGQQVLEGNVEEILSSLDDNSFDAILASHVLEHVKRPIDLLEEATRLLRPGGLLVLGLPTERNIFRNLLRMDYYAGTHLYSFTTRNTEVLLQQVGLVPDSGVIYHLPQLRGEAGVRVHRLWNAVPRLPGREFCSLAYWQVATKPS